MFLYLIINLTNLKTLSLLHYFSIITVKFFSWECSIQRNAYSILVVSYKPLSIKQVVHISIDEENKYSFNQKIPISEKVLQSYKILHKNGSGQTVCILTVGF